MPACPARGAIPSGRCTGELKSCIKGDVLSPLCRSVIASGIRRCAIKATLAMLALRRKPPRDCTTGMTASAARSQPVLRVQAERFPNVQVLLLRRSRWDGIRARSCRDLVPSREALMNCSPSSSLCILLTAFSRACCCRSWSSIHEICAGRP